MDEDCIFDVRNALATDDLQRAIRHHRELAYHLCGVFARDELIHHRCRGRYPRLHVVNTDESTGKGRHWIAYILIRPHIVKVFDSYGLHPRVYGKDLWHYLERVCKGGNLYVHPYRYQSINTIVCGYYTLFFICKCMHYKRHGLPYVRRAFSPKHSYMNDKRVMGWALNYFKTLLPLCSNKHQSCQPLHVWRRK